MNNDRSKLSAKRVLEWDDMAATDMRQTACFTPAPPLDNDNDNDNDNVNDNANTEEILIEDLPLEVPEGPGDLATVQHVDAIDKTLVTPMPYALEAPLVGRARELAALREVYRRSCTDLQLSLALVIGDTGMGKTRIVDEFTKRIVHGDRMVRVLTGSGARTAYAPFARLLEERFHISPRMSVEECQQRIVDGVGTVLPATRSTDVTHLLAHLMGIPFVDSPVIAPLIESPAQLESRIFIALRRFIAADLARGPLVLVLENLDRCGPETVHLLHYLAAGLSEMPLTIIATAQETLYQTHPSFASGRLAKQLAPPHRATTSGDIDIERIDLPPLSPEAAAELIRELCHSMTSIPRKLMDHVRQMSVSDRSPRTLMELVRLLLENRTIERMDESQWHVDLTRLAAAQLPNSYADIVAERLALAADEERQLLEQCASIGETFWLDAVTALVRTRTLASEQLDGPTMRGITHSQRYARTSVARAIEHLIDREWIARVEESSSASDEPEFRFANSVLWSLVYEQTDMEERRAYHRVTAQWLELRPGSHGMEAQQDIARHLEWAGDTAGAAQRYRRAADAARAVFFNDRATTLYKQALTCIGNEDLAMRVQLWQDLGAVHELKGESEAALGAFERMLKLSWLLAARSKAAEAFNKMGRLWRRKGDLKLAQEYLQRAATLFEQTGNVSGVAESFDDIGHVLFLLGQYEEAYKKIHTALEWRDRVGDARAIAMSLTNLGNLQKARGRFDEAHRCYQQALELRRDSGDRWGVTVSLNNLAVLACERGDNEHARAGWLQALGEAKEIGALPLAAVTLCNLGELSFIEGRYQDAKQRTAEALDIASDIDERRLQSESMRNLALIENALGNASTARNLAHRAHAVAAAAGLRECEARALVCLGDVFSASLYDADSDSLSTDELPQARDYYERGIALLREIGNESDLAHALEHFGRYSIERGEGQSGKVHLHEALSIYRKLDMKRSEEVARLLSSL